MQIIYDGIKFNKDLKTGYYLSSKNIEGKRIRLHRYVWQKHHGPIPSGFHVHHKDHDKDNNDIDNLILLSQSKHMSHHAHHLTEEQKERRHEHVLTMIDKMAEWHKTEEGHQWHKEQFDRSLRKYLEPVNDRICEICGAEYKVNDALKDRSRFCSNNCKSTYRRRSGIDNIEKECSTCGNLYKTNKYAPAKYCSRQCRKGQKH